MSLKWQRSEASKDSPFTFWMGVTSRPPVAQVYAVQFKMLIT